MRPDCVHPANASLHARNAEICRRAEAGEQSGDLAAEFGVSRQRIQQIVARGSTLGRDELRARRRERRKVDWTCAHCGKAMRTPRWRVWTCCSPACAARHAAPHRAYDAGYMIDALRWLALRLGHTPQQMEVLPPLPHWVTYHRRLGSLRNAVLVAGLAPNHQGVGPQPLTPWFRDRFGHLALCESLDDLRAWRES